MPKLVPDVLMRGFGLNTCRLIEIDVAVRAHIARSGSNLEVDQLESLEGPTLDDWMSAAAKRLALALFILLQRGERIPHLRFFCLRNADQRKGTSSVPDTYFCASLGEL